MAYIKILILFLIINTAWARTPDPDVVHSAERIVAIGDLHGDIFALKRVLRIANLIDDKNNWTGKNTILVQVGDQTDRGDFELEIITLLEKLSIQAVKMGGKVLTLLGNHEIMNAVLDFRFVTPLGLSKFSKFTTPISPPLQKKLLKIPKGQKGRSIAFFPGGQVSNILSNHNVAVIVGDSVFVHGGILPKWAKYGISKINQETRAFLKGKIPNVPNGIYTNDGLLWSRHFSLNTGPANCELLKESLKILGVKRMIVAHTVQLDGINNACDEMVWRVDVGMSHFYGGQAQALEIRGNQINILK
ncbi:MAG: calcineurin [Epsilonproteobacteria bacterium]|nr:MAG: calcineurin [Campylobacterota bacterium]RLA65798.1 MAG: calcineurin [Campylobacterota bacterium]